MGQQPSLRVSGESLPLQEFLLGAVVMDSQCPRWFDEIRRWLAVELQIQLNDCTDDIVLRTVTEWARQSTFRLSREYVDAVADDAVAILSTAVCQFRPGGSFKSWCQRVFRNEAIDRARKAARERVLPLGTHDPAEHRSADAKEPDRFRTMMSQVQEIVEQLDWPPPRPGAVDLFVVLLMELRLTLAARGAITFDLDSERLALLGGLSGFVEQVLPWTPQQQNRCFKPGFPTLQACWDACSAYWEDTQANGHSDKNRRPIIDRGTFCRLVSELHDDAPDLTTDCWYQWVRRSKAAARQHLATEDWDRYLAPFMPDHRK